MFPYSNSFCVGFVALLNSELGRGNVTSERVVVVGGNRFEGNAIERGGGGGYFGEFE